MIDRNRKVLESWLNATGKTSLDKYFLSGVSAQRFASYYKVKCFDIYTRKQKRCKYALVLSKLECLNLIQGYVYDELLKHGDESPKLVKYLGDDFLFKVVNRSGLRNFFMSQLSDALMEKGLEYAKTLAKRYPEMDELEIPESLDSDMQYITQLAECYTMELSDESIYAQLKKKLKEGLFTAFMEGGIIRESAITELIAKKNLDIRVLTDLADISPLYSTSYTYEGNTYSISLYDYKDIR